MQVSILQFLDLLNLVGEDTVLVCSYIKENW